MMQTRIDRRVNAIGILGSGILAVFILFSLGSCKKSVPPGPIPITPLQTLINSDSSLSLYHRLLLQANDAALLANDSVTLLIPVNAAFEAAGYPEIIIDSLSASQADNLIRYHFIPSRVILAADSGVYLPFTSLSGFTVFGMSDGRHTLFNDIAAVRDTAATGNAIVYLLSGVMGAPADSLDELLASDSSLSFLAEAFQRTGLDSVLSTGQFTLLAPNNSAFQSAGYDSLGAIDSADLTSLTRLMEYQVVPGIFFPNNLVGQTSLPTLEGSVVSVNMLNGSFQFTGTSNLVPANLLPGTQLAGNTILVYQIDQVLSP